MERRNMESIKPRGEISGVKRRRTNPHENTFLGYSAGTATMSVELSVGKFLCSSFIRVQCTAIRWPITDLKYGLYCGSGLVGHVR